MSAVSRRLREVSELFRPTHCPHAAFRLVQAARHFDFKVTCKLGRPAVIITNWAVACVPVDELMGRIWEDVERVIH
ncbi:MAG: hypothetical protein GTO63_30180 [Anaerolineae bacterium]|nr:hypothetical protein [Anaerolineae bacterium]NIN98973.1 hypothetical protein [Anaerolineae bacterium]